MKSDHIQTIIDVGGKTNAGHFQASAYVTGTRNNILSSKTFVVYLVKLKTIANII